MYRPKIVVKSSIAIRKNALQKASVLVKIEKNMELVKKVNKKLNVPPKMYNGKKYVHEKAVAEKLRLRG